MSTSRAASPTVSAQHTSEPIRETPRFFRPTKLNPDPQLPEGIFSVGPDVVRQYFPEVRRPGPNAPVIRHTREVAQAENPFVIWTPSAEHPHVLNDQYREVVGQNPQIYVHHIAVVNIAGGEYYKQSHNFGIAGSTVDPSIFTTPNSFSFLPLHQSPPTSHPTHEVTGMPPGPPLQYFFPETYEDEESKAQKAALEEARQQMNARLQSLGQSNAPFGQLPAVVTP